MKHKILLTCCHLFILSLNPDLLSNTNRKFFPPPQFCHKHYPNLILIKLTFVQGKKFKYFGHKDFFILVI